MVLSPIIKYISWNSRHDSKNKENKKKKNKCCKIY